jgi:adenylylsulfate kinase
MRTSNITWQHTTVSNSQRQQLTQQKPVLLWFTGMSGSGKTTLANGVEAQLHRLRYHTFLLDGDNIRHGLCKDLGFSDADRKENLRRVAEIARLFLDAGIITLAAFISPMAQDREQVRAMFAKSDFIEIYCQCPLDICERRDVKGLYKQARLGQVTNFTGISSKYEPPQSPDLTIETNNVDITTSINLVLGLLYSRNIISPQGH